MLILDQHQKAAVNAEEKSVLVLAGAGSGKTTVMVERVAHLIEKRQVSPYSILAFTFTRKAAGEMKKRLERRIGNMAHKITCGTMHSIALRQLQKYGHHVGYRAGRITVYGEWEEQYLRREVARDLGHLTGYAKPKWKVPKKLVDQVFHTYYTQGVIPEEMQDGAAWEVFQAFVSRCKENNALTFGGLILGLLSIVDPVCQWNNWSHVIVDEVQDIDIVQWRVINRMVSLLPAEFYCVGDIDQSIFEWRGAVPSYLVNNRDRFAIYPLRFNYRSTEPIVSAANRLIEHNQYRLEKEMEPIIEGKPVVVHKNIDTEALVMLLQEHYDDVSVAKKKTAILARTHSLLKKASAMLTPIGAYEVGKTTYLLNTEHFRRWLAWLKLAVNPHDNFAFLLIRDMLMLTPEEYGQIRKDAAAQGRSHFQVYMGDTRHVSSGDWFNRYHHWDFESAIANLTSLWDPTFGAWIGEEDFDPKAKTIVEAALDFAVDWAKGQNLIDTACNEGPIQNFLEYVATFDLSEDVAQGEDFWLQLMTIHAAKGLEFERVIVFGCNEGILPNKQALKNDEVEQERRLAYVAWTRAENELILAVRPELSEGARGNIIENPISRFVRESSHAAKPK